MTFWLSRLSRRRRSAVGLAAVPAVVTVTAIQTGSSQASGAAIYPAQDRPRPVLLVPGYGGNTGSLSVLARRIRSTGRQATVLHLRGNGTGSLITDASVLNTAVSRALRGGAPLVDVIGYSAGGSPHCCGRAATAECTRRGGSLPWAPRSTAPTSPPQPRRSCRAVAAGAQTARLPR